jgi:hypothetical protein
MVMIPMECPKCGRRGSVPSNRLMVGLSCKSCNAPFYMNTAGEAVLGEPPMTKEERRAREKAEKKRDKDRKQKTESAGFNFDFFGSYKEMDSSERTKKLSVIAGCLVVVFGLMVWLSRPTPDPLNERGKYVVRAFLDKDENKLRQVSARNTGEDSVLWAQKMRGRLGIKGNSGDFKYTVDIMSGSQKEGGATVMALIEPINPSAVGPPEIEDTKKGGAAKKKNEPPTPVSPFLNLQMAFVRGPEGQWLLDGNMSLLTVPK